MAGRFSKNDELEEKKNFSSSDSQKDETDDFDSKELELITHSGFGFLTSDEDEEEIDTTSDKYRLSMGLSAYYHE